MKCKFFIFMAYVWLGFVPQGKALTANKVWFEFRDNGRYRVTINYTVPELREFRETWVEFAQKKEAEKFYFDVVRGADFYLPDSKVRLFNNPSTETLTAAEPW